MAKLKQMRPNWINLKIKFNGIITMHRMKFMKKEISSFKSCINKMMNYGMITMRYIIIFMEIHQNTSPHNNMAMIIS